MEQKRKSMFKISNKPANDLNKNNKKLKLKR
jgi:hypothetical protein